MAEKKPKKTREQILDEAKARTDAMLARRAARAEQQRIAAAAAKQPRALDARALFDQQSRMPTSRPLGSLLPRPTIEQASQYADPNVLRRMAGQQAAARSGRAGPVRPPNTPLEAFQRNPSGRTPSRGFRTTTPRTPLLEGPFRPPANILGRSLRALGKGAFGGAELLLDPTVVEAPTKYDIEAQHAFGMPMEDFYAQMTPEQDFIPGLDMVPDDMELSPEQIAAMDADYFDMGGQVPGSGGDTQLLPEDGMSAYSFGQDYLNPLLTSIPTGYNALVEGPGRGIADLLRGAAGYDPLMEEQELIGAVDRPDLAAQLAELNTPQDLEDIPDPMVDYGIISPDDLREQVMLEYMQGQQQADPRQRQIMGSANEFAANRPEPRMSPQQLDEYMRMIARDESINAGLAGDPLAGYDESLLPEGAQVSVDPVTGATNFAGNQDYIPDAALTGRQSMDDLRLGTEYTSRALRNLGRARGVPSPQEVERKRMLSTLGGDARGQGYRADQLAEQMRRTRSGLNASNLTPLELDAGRSQLESQGAELAAARGGAEQARALQLQGSMQPVPPAPEDFELQQLQEAETARTQAQAVADQRRLLKELDIESRGRVDARDMQQYTEMFSSMEPSAVPPGMSLAHADPEVQEAERARINRIQLATSLAGMREEFRTQPAIAMQVSRILSGFPPEEQAKALQWLGKQDDIGAALEELMALGGG